MKTAILILTATQSLFPGSAVPRNLVAAQAPAKQQDFASAPQCATSGANVLTITCAYSATSPVSADSRTAPRITLDRAVISFDPTNESHMKVDLTFRNDSGTKIAEQRTVFLAIDNERGENQLRRPLAHVDFTYLEPGRPTKFQETLLTPAFSPGPYIVSIWVPSTDPSLEFNPAYNFLLSSNGVPDAATGLNRIAKFTSAASSGRKSAAKPD